MGALTWREVSAPDFRPAMEGYQQFSNLLGNAFNTARSTLNQVDNSISDRVNNEMLAKIIQAQDVESAKSLADELLSDPNNVRRADAKTLSAIAARPQEVITQQTAENQFMRAQEREALNKALRPVMAQIQRNNALGTPEGAAEAQRLLNENSALLDQMDPEQQMAMLSNGMDWQRKRNASQRDDIGLASERLNLTENEWDYKRKLEDFQDSEEAQNILANIRQSGVTDGASALASLNSLGLTDGKLYNTVAAALTNIYGNSVNEYAQTRVDEGLDFGSGGGGGANRSYRGGSAYNSVLGDGQFGLPSKPITEMTMGEVYDFGRKTLIPNSKKANVGRDSRGLLGSSAVGAYQFTGETLAGNSKKPGLAQELYGDNWRNVKFTPAVQDAMAEVLFNRSKNGNLKKIWEGLPDSRPGAYANKTWAEMKQIILRHEVGDSGPGRGGGSRGGEFKPVMPGEIEGLMTAFSKIDGSNPGNVALREFQPLTVGPRAKTSAQEEANRIAKLNKNISPDVLRDTINATAAKYKVTPAVAGFMVERSIKTDRSTVFGLVPTINNKGTYVDAKALARQGALFGDRGMKAIETAVLAGESGTYQAKVDAALKQAGAAHNKYQAARIAKQNNPNLDISGATQDYNLAQQLLRQAVDEAYGLVNKRLPATKKTATKAKTAPKKLQSRQDAYFAMASR